MQFYIRHAKPDDGEFSIHKIFVKLLKFVFSVNAFKQEKKLKSFGMPFYLGSGSHEFNGEKYRFVVTEHFGTDLWKTFLENNEIFPPTTVFKIGTQIVSKIQISCYYSGCDVAVIKSFNHIVF